MPILKPEIQNALREVGLDHKSGDTDLATKLDAAGLSINEAAETAAGIMRNGGSEMVRLRAAELALKAHNVGRDQPMQMPNITFIIRDPKSVPGVINQILIPRELTR